MTAAPPGFVPAKTNITSIRVPTEQAAVMQGADGATEKGSGEHASFGSYVSSPRGLLFKSEDPDEPATRLCGPLRIVAETRSEENGSWGVLVSWHDHDGKEHELAIPRSSLAGNGEEARKILMDGGLSVSTATKARQLFNTYLAEVNSMHRARAVSRIGWHGDSFVFPDRAVGNSNGERIILQNLLNRSNTFRQRGTLAEWQSDIAELAVGNSRLSMSVGAALAAPLLQLVDAESDGIHLRGASSTGKSTALTVAGSVWGGGGTSGYIRQWRATDNGLEAVALAHCDALLCLDELGQVDPKSAANTAYMLANGMGKSRAGRSGEGRPPAEWRTLFLSNGEIGLSDKIREGDRTKRAAAGQQVRVVDIPADAGAGLGLFEDIHGYPDPDRFAQHLKRRSRECYGYAAIAFLESITKDLDGARVAVKGYVTEFVQEVSAPGADGQVARVAQRLGLVAAAGEFARVLGILPWPEGEAQRGARRCFEDWLDARGGTEPAEQKAAIAAVRHFLELHGEARFASASDTEAGRPTINRAGFRKRREDGGERFLILAETFRSEVCAGLDPKLVAQVLRDRGLLIADADGRLTRKERVPALGTSARFYVVEPGIFEAD